MFELEIFDEEEDEINAAITALFAQQHFSKFTENLLRPVIHHILAKDVIEDIREVAIFTVLYVATEVIGWESFTTPDNLDAYFENDHTLEMIDGSNGLQSKFSIPTTSAKENFNSFMAEQFITIFCVP